MLSINTRIVLSAGMVMAVFIILTGLALDQAFRNSARSAMQERLLGQTYLLIGAAEVDDGGVLRMPAALAEARFSTPGSGLYARITQADGATAWLSPSSVGTPTPAPVSLTAGAQVFLDREAEDGRGYHMLAFGVQWVLGSRRIPFTINIMEDLNAYHDQIRSYRHSLWGWLGAMAVLLLAGQAWVLRWGLRPLRTVTTELASIESGRQETLQETYPSELRGLTGNLNTLLNKERALQARYRNALADLAHSLKTPLAVLRAALPGNRVRQPLEVVVEEQVKRMDHIVDYQLQRAATAGPAALATPVAIRPVAEKIVESLRKVHHGKEVNTQFDIEAGIAFYGDEGDLMELLGNLFDNAWKWCRSEVRFHAGETRGHLELRVEDDGPGIGAEQAELLTERGVRADERVPGHGIGLAVVRDITDAYRGVLEIGATRAGGASIRIRLPSAAGDTA